MEKYLRNKKIAIGFKEEVEPHEILLDSLAQKKEEEIGISEKKFEVSLSKNILQGFFIFTLILIIILFAKAFQLQVIEGKHFSALAEENKFIIHSIQAERGVIYDRNFKQLVFNQPNFDLVCKKNDLPKEKITKEKVLREISQILKIDLEELEKKIEESQTPTVLISENLSHQLLIILETKIKELPGFQIENNTVRDYLDGPSFSHLIGYKRKTGGKTNLEKSYDETLRERPGEILVERDARGNLISQKIIKFPESGKSLVLWLDSELQRKIEQELKKKMKETGAETAAAVALDPKTGGILALVSLPSFDNNLFSKGMAEQEWKKINNDPLKPLFNRAISGGFLTGSTIKPLIASAALEEKIISPQKKINCQGKIEVKHEYQPEVIYIFRDWKTHGWTDLRKAIAESCNVYFYHIGGGYKDQEGLGPTKIKEYLELFGWGSKTGIDLPEEAQGFLPDPIWKKEKLGKIWYDGDTYHLSIGQGYLRITPLQVAASFVAIANRGKLFQPQVVREIVDSNKNLIKKIEPKIIREGFIKPENLEIVREGMRQAVTEGTAKELDQLKVPVAAKTGSAQTGKKDPKDKKDYLDNWITVFAPYEDPQIVLTIMINDVKEGQIVTPPVAKAILEWYFSKTVEK
ncbi:MAG: penicillin-binding protein 2 [Patescibacteria group bacterium]|nr:penicillin-binding protein 2 [Patescibacteria group bacterium]